MPSARPRRRSASCSPPPDPPAGKHKAPHLRGFVLSVANASSVGAISIANRTAGSACDAQGAASPPLANEFAPTGARGDSDNHTLAAQVVVVGAAEVGHAGFRELDDARGQG